MYGIDTGAPGILRVRSWRWLRIRILGLLSTDSRTARHFAPPDDQKAGGAGRGAHHR